MAPVRWGDEEDDSSTEGEESSTPNIIAPSFGGISTGGETNPSGLAIPPPHTSKIDSKGVKTVTLYRVDPSNPNQILKIVTKICVYFEQ